MSKAKTAPKPRAKPEDANQAAFRLVREATGQAPKTAPPEKNAAAVALGKLGGLKGGKARAAALTPARRKAIAKNAARSRWDSESE